MRKDYTLARMAKMKILMTPNIDKDVEQPELSCIAGGNVKWYNYFGGKKSYQVSYKTQHSYKTQNK